MTLRHEPVLHEVGHACLRIPGIVVSMQPTLN